MVAALEATPALTCIAAVADEIAERFAGDAIEDRRYGPGESRHPTLRTLTITSGATHVIVLNGSASSPAPDTVVVRFASPLSAVYASWTVPATSCAPGVIVAAVAAFRAAGSAGWSRDAAGAGIAAAGRILDSLGGARVGDEDPDRPG